MNQKAKHLILFLFSIAILISTVFIPGIARNSEEIKRIRFGYPLPFVSQDSSYYDTFHFFPRYMKLEFGNDFPKNIYYGKLILSFLIVFVSIELLIYVIEKIYLWLRKE